MYFDVYLNGEKLGTFGAYAFAGAVCREGEQRYHYSWLQRDIGAKDEVRIVPAVQGAVPEPIKKFEMGRTVRKAWEANMCGFCQRNDTEVKRLIPGDENRPGICSDCVELCNEILREPA